MEKSCNLGKNYMIRKYVNPQTFFNPENQLADKNQLFPCLHFGGEGGFALPHGTDGQSGKGE